MNLTFWLFAVPFIAALLCALFRSNRLLSNISMAGMALTLVLILAVCLPVFRGETLDQEMLYIDTLSAFFMVITALISMMVAAYSKGYLRFEQKNEDVTPREVRFYYVVFNIFAGTMILTFAVKSMALIWVCIGSTTLVSAFLVGFHKDEQSTEAAWKYILLCSVGITLALFGIAMLYASSSGSLHEFSSLDWPSLMAHAAELDPVLIKFAAVFIILGYGTKMGLAPMHPWLPDAHSQAPTPISAMMSGVLLNCAMYGIMRFYAISEAAIPGFSKTVLLIFGLLSLLIAAAFIIKAKNIKRMLAYSSIENMGLVAIGLGIGTPLAIFAVMIQITAHSLSKPLMFFAAGNVVQAYGTKDMASIRGVYAKMPFSGFMMTAGILAIAGAPPFAMFVGEVALLMGILDAGHFAVAGIVLLLLIAVFAGLTRNVFPMLTGEADRPVADPRSTTRILPLAVLLAFTVLFGLFMPDSLRDILEAAARAVMGGLA